MPDHRPFPPGSRRVPRPAEVRTCPSCGGLAGRGYSTCAWCAELVDQFWLADWAELRSAARITPGSVEERELAELILAEDVGEHPWTCTDWALTLLRCKECTSELGTGPVECTSCKVADERRWAWDHQGHPMSMTGNEHVLRVGRAVLRAAHRQRETVVLSWRLTFPFLITGELPENGQLQRVRAQVLAGRYDELAACPTFVQMAGLPDIPWRCIS